MRRATTQAEFDAIVADGDEVEVREGYFEARGSAVVYASGSSSVVAYDSSSVVASGSSSVRASGSSSVVAYDSSSVRASDSSSVRASDSSSVVASGSNTIVQQHSPTAKVTAENVIQVTKPSTVDEWLVSYGITPVDGVVTLFKAVNGEYRSPRGGVYTPGAVPVADDWDNGVAECGGGLHFSPFPWMALNYNGDAKRFVACPVSVDSIRSPHPDDMYPDKVKAPGCAGPVWECDLDGNQIGGDK